MTEEGMIWASFMMGLAEMTGWTPEDIMWGMPYSTLMKMTRSIALRQKNSRVDEQEKENKRIAQDPTIMPGLDMRGLY